MAYIYLEELKEILPTILADYLLQDIIDDDDWEWIYSEIEQKCHAGKRLKGKKWEKKMLDEMDQLFVKQDYDASQIKYIKEHLDKIDKTMSKELVTKRTIDLINNKINGDINRLSSRIDILMLRTSTDYANPVENISEGLCKKIVNICQANHAGFHELNTICDMFNKYVLKDDIFDVNTADAMTNRDPCYKCKYYKEHNKDCDAIVGMCTNGDKFEEKDDSIMKQDPDDED